MNKQTIISTYVIRKYLTLEFNQLPTTLEEPACMYMWHSDDRVGLDTLYATRRTAQTRDNVAHLGNPRRLCMHDEIVQWSRGRVV